MPEITSQPAKKGPTTLAQILVSASSKFSNQDLPPPEDQFVAHIPPDLTELDLDIIKLTAQFVARNGQAFQVGLLNREHKNPQFDFLKHDNPFHSFYLRLVESYTKCLVPPKNFVEKLKEEFSNKQNILERVIERYEAEKKQRTLKEAAEKQESEQQSSYQINWGDFVIVETLDFGIEEEENAATTKTVNVPQEEKPPVVETNRIEEMEEDMEVEDEENVQTAKPSPIKSAMEMKVRKDYVRPNLTKKAVPVQYQLCPRCGQQVPVDEIMEHMKQELQSGSTNQPKSDPKKPSLAPDSAISQNLKAFAKRRTDIFGKEETDIGKTITSEAAKQQQQQQQQQNEEKDSWDGQSIVRAPVPRLTPEVKPVVLPTDPNMIYAPPTHMGQPAILHPPEQYMMGGVMHQPGMIPQAINLTPGMNSNMKAPMLISPNSGVPFQVPTRSPFIPGPSPLEPAPKKQKLNEEEQKLISEEEFLQNNQEPITIKIQIPVDDKADGMKGQLLTFDNVSLKSTLSDLKEKVKGAIGMPPNKQKIKSDSLGVLRDQNTLAYYNFVNGTILQLDKKERGGKAKKK